MAVPVRAPLLALLACVAPRVAAAQAPPPAPALPPMVVGDPLAQHPRLTGAARDDMRQACADRAPHCDPIAILGRLERDALAHALRARGLLLDGQPHGKRIRRVHVVTMPVIGEEAAFLQWANVFHVESKEHVVARELVVGPGDRWNADDIDESARRLRDPLFSSLAVVVAVVPPDAPLGGDEVDVLVVTRDVWSLRTNYNGEWQKDHFSFLTVSLSENNLFGRRKLLAMVFRMDQSAFTLGPLYIDKNLAGQHVDLRLRGGPIWNRASRDIEGSESYVTLARPLWSLGTRWGAFLDWSHRDAIDRTFSDDGVALWDDPDTDAEEAVPWQYRQRQWSIGASGVYSINTCARRYKHNWKAGYSLASQRSRVLDEPGAPPEQVAQFEDKVLPRSERTGTVWAGYEIYTPRYRDYQDVDSFDLAESLRLGPRGQVVLGLARPELGSEKSFGTVSLEGSWAIAFGDDGYASTGASFSARLEGGRLIDRGVAQSLRVVTPSVSIGRAVIEARVAGFFREEGNRLLAVGGNAGLRGYPVNAFVGERSAVVQTELRSRSVRLLLGTRWGAVLFHDLAAAADQIGELQPYQDVGVGVRGLVPQTSPEIFRFDLAFPLDGAYRGRPRFIAGYRQAF